MGSCLSSASTISDDSAKSLARHNEVEKQLKQSRREWMSQSKVLLLGSGDSGKTTVLKQMRVMHNMPWSPLEIESFRQLVFLNVIQGARMMLEATLELDQSLSSENKKRLSLLPSPEVKQTEPFPTHILPILSEIWSDRDVQSCWSRCSELALPDNIPYFFKALPRLFDPKYVPSTQDIIHTRARTTGIVETIFNINRRSSTGVSQIHMVDVGGQKNERRKWIHCFQNVRAVLFLVSLSGYNQSLFEERETNQMQDAMALWDNISHSEWFKATSMILFLNKNDIFRKKVPKWPIKNYFPDFEGPLDVESGRTYFKKRFVRLAMKNVVNVERSVYVHYTTATDTELLKVVMGAVSDIILRDNFAKAAII